MAPRAGWLRARRASLVPSEGADPPQGAAALWLAVDAAGEGFTVKGYGFGPAGPPGSDVVPLALLVDAADEDLERQV